MLDLSHLTDKLKLLHDLLVHSNSYRPFLKLRGPSGINTLSISPVGRYLACGGNAGIRVWNLPSGHPIQTPDYDSKVQGQITETKWMGNGEGNIPCLLLGTGMGNLIAWRFDMAEDRFREAWVKENLQAGAVEAISVDGNMIAVIYRRQMIIGFKFEASGVQQIWTYHFEVTIPRSVAHCEGDVLVWGLMDGALHRLKGDTGKPIDMKLFPEQIGCGIYRQVQGRLEVAIDTLDGGCRVYRGAETKEPYRFCAVPRSRTYSVVKQILWIEDEKILACGSDHGKAYLFNEESLCIQRIRHGPKDGTVQSLAFSKTPTHWILATSVMEGDDTIRI